MKRDEFERQARLLIIGCAGCNEDPCIYCLVPSGDDTMSQLMALVDQYLDSALAEPPLRRRRPASHQEMWTASQVAEYLGLSDENSARATMSRRKIRSVKIGSDISRYPADEVRAIREAREASKR